MPSLAQLFKIDLSPIVPAAISAKAKAVVPAVLTVVAVAVQIGVIDAPTGAWVTTIVLGVAGVIGVHNTVNS